VSIFKKSVEVLKIISFLVLVLFSIAQMKGQALADYVIVKDIVIKGNRRTQEKVMLIELDFKKGDTLSVQNLGKQIERNKKRLLSIGLFNFVNFNIKDWNYETGELYFEITVVENWYIYPSIILEFADRSFNVWWKDENFALDRVNYGLRLDHFNLTGQKDRLKLKFQRGFQYKYEAEYEIPNIYNGWGLGANILFSENREIGYKTTNNRINFIKLEDERVLLNRLRAGFSFSKRNTAHLNQVVRFEVNRFEIDTSVSQRLNPSYLLNGRQKMTYGLLSYSMVYDKRLYPVYPEGGYFIFFDVKKFGWNSKSDYNNLTVEVEGQNYFKLAEKLYLGNRAKVRFNLNRDPLAYINNNSIGHGGNNLRGYELYVMDGSDYLIASTALRYQFWQKVVDFGRFMPVKAFKLMPIASNIRFVYNTGYAYEPTYKQTNALNNTWLNGYGVALDFLLLNNYLFAIEYNFNQIGDRGLYLQSSFNF